METSWQNELRKYWRMIENETETLLKHECIKDNMLFDSGFKIDFLKKANEKYYEIPKKYVVFHYVDLKKTYHFYLIAELQTLM